MVTLPSAVESPRFASACCVLVLALLVPLVAHGAPPPPDVDHHQHLFRPETSGLRVSADDLVTLLDEAGIARAVVHSLAYQISNPNKPRPADEYERVKAENDWTSREVARHPTRLRGFCSVNPLRDFAVAEIDRCARGPHLRAGLKLHFGNSDVDLENPDHVRRLREVFAAANRARMAIVVHVRPSLSRQRPYGATQARRFVDGVLPAAPDVPVQIAHLAGAGGYDDPAIDAALVAFCDAIERGGAARAGLFFDVSGVVGIGQWEEKATLIAARIRQLGVERVLFGSDGAVGGNTPAKSWAAFQRLPLTPAEFQTIAGNVAPYLR